jgi:hypothetical protein
MLLKIKVFILVKSINLSQINTKTQIYFPKYTTLLTKPNLYQKTYTSGNNKLIFTTK